MGMMLLVKVSIVWTVTLALARLLAGSPAVARHRLWTLGFCCVLTLPPRYVAASLRGSTADLAGNWFEAVLKRERPGAAGRA